MIHFKLKLMSLLLLFVCAAPNLQAEPQPNISFIDRIQVTGTAKISGEELAKSLDIPVGEPVSGTEMSEILVESERRLKASGKYKNDLTIKLVRSKKFPHFIVEVELDEVDRWYFGADGSYAHGPAFLGDNEYTSFQYMRQSLGAQLYYGTRDYNDHGLALDLEWLTNASRLSAKSNSDQFKLNQTYQFSFSGLTASAIQKRFLTDYTYAGVISRAIVSKSWNSSEGSYESTYDNVRTRVVSSYSTEDQSINGTVEPVLGVRVHKLLLGGKFSRSISRPLKTRQNISEITYKNDVEQPQRTQAGDRNDSNNSFNNTAEFSFMWSDKSQLTVIEPGLDLHATWSRNYYSYQTDPPKWLAHAEYTFLLSDQLASTLLSDGEWEYRQPSPWSSKLKRIIDIGLRFDYVTYQEMIFFGEFYRIGGKRNEVKSSYENDHLILDNRISAGVKYASPSLIYSFCFSYGAPLAGEYFIGSSIDSVYKRLGVR